MKELNIKFKPDGTADIIGVDSSTVQKLILLINSPREKEPGVVVKDKANPNSAPKRRYHKVRKLLKHHRIERCSNPTCIRPINKPFKAVRPSTKFCSRACCNNFWTTTRQIEAKKKDQEKLMHKKGQVIVKGDSITGGH